MFWVIASIILFLAALLALLPMLRRRSLSQATAIALVFLLPAAGLWIYGQVGTPQAIGLGGTAAGTPPHASMTQAPSADDIETMIESLKAKLTESPADLEGWVLLARTLKTMKRYPEALEALQTANRISPNDPYLTTELVETEIFTSPDGRITGDMESRLKWAIDQDPSQQKAWWLLGVAATQRGDDMTAVDYWEQLEQQLEPGSTIANSLQSQIDAARIRMGLEPASTQAMPVAAATAGQPAATTGGQPGPTAQEPSSTPAAGGWQGTEVSVKASDALKSDMPASSVLYIVIRGPGPAVGPPLGVKRINNPTLPVSVTITDQDSMMQQRKISAESEIHVQARLSLSGSPAARPGDWQSTPTVISLSSTDPVELTLDQQVE
ncbi:MAG: tetratricopeptide repeat protein [Lysobacterales bacterium]|jgi:cytochrome c-type biogenesis protein CcmH